MYLFLENCVSSSQPGDTSSKIIQKPSKLEAENWLNKM
jgi:hypothetical protein